MFSSNIRSVWTMLTCPGQRQRSCRPSSVKKKTTIWNFCDVFCIHIHRWEGTQQKEKKTKKVQKLPYQSGSSLENRVIVAIPTHQAMCCVCFSVVIPSQQTTSSRTDFFRVWIFIFSGEKAALPPMLIIVHCLKSKNKFFARFFSVTFDNLRFFPSPSRFSVSFPFANPPGCWQAVRRQGSSGRHVREWRGNSS